MSLPYLLPTPGKCKISLLSPAELTPLLDFLHLSDLFRLHEALYSHQKTKEGAKTVVAYIAKRERIYSAVELR